MEQFDINEVATNLVERKIASLCGTLTDSTKDIASKLSVEFGISFKNYLRNTYEKYSKIKTILYKTEPQKLYDFFESSYLEYNNQQILTNDIGDILNISHFLLISGTGGIGKSTLMKHFFLSMCSKNFLVPILIDLKDFNKDDFDLFDRLYKTLNKFGFKLKSEYLLHGLNSGLFFILLDGLDEVISDKYEYVLSEINDFCDNFSKNYFIITSRPSRNFISLYRFTELKTLPFTKQQTLNLVNKLKYDNATKIQFLKDLDESLYDSHLSFASNPLLLNIMLLTYEDYSEIPRKLHIFYSNAFETLYRRHDSTKGAFKREMQSTLTYNDFKNIFKHVCFSTYAKNMLHLSDSDLKAELAQAKKALKITFDDKDYINDLIHSVCLLIKDGQLYTFSHRSFQEYFTSLYILDLPDDRQLKVTKYLVSKYTIRLVTDSVFDMLYDINTSRFENSILYPMAKEIQSNIDSYMQSGFCEQIAFYKVIKTKCTFSFYKDNKFSIRRLTNASPHEILWHFALNIIMDTRPPKRIVISEEQVNCIKEQYKKIKGSNGFITVDDFKDNPLIYKTINNSHVNKLYFFKKLIDILENNRNNFDYELDDILSITS